MPRGRKLGTKAKKSTKSASKATERKARSSSVSAKNINTTKENIKTQKPKTYDTTAIKTAAEFFDALAEKEAKLTLGDNIIVAQNILINHDLEIDFNGFSIIAEESMAAARVLDVRSGKVTLSGQGKVFAMGERGVAIRVFGAISAGVPHYTEVTVGKGISLYAPDSYGILVSPNLGVAYGVMVKLAGKIMAHDGICVASGIHGDAQNCPKVIIEKTASIITDETSGVALEASGYGKWQITQTCLHGAVGTVARTGVLEFRNTQLLAHNGETFRIEDGSEKELKIKIEGGTYLSENTHTIGGLSEPIQQFIAKNCELYSPLDEAIAPEIEACMTIDDCEFESDIEGCLESLIMLGDAEEVETSEEKTADDVATPEPTVAVEPEPAQTDESSIDETYDELELLDDDTFVDEMFEFTDELGDLDDPELILEPKSKSKKSTKPVIEKEPEELKAAPKFAELTKDIAKDDVAAEKLAAEVAKEPVISAAPDMVAAVSPKSPKTTKKSKKPKKTPKILPPAAQFLPFTASLDLAPELTDAETDEQEILLALNSEDADAEPMTPPIMRPPVPMDIGEHEAAKMALADAIAEIRKLSAADYDTGFSSLEQALKKAECVLAKPGADLVAIRDAAAGLLQAFDALEEHDDSALSDAELDELFYQGAVLEEMLQPQKHLASTHVATQPKINADSDSALVQTEITKVAAGVRTPHVMKAPVAAEPDFTVLSDILTTISTLNLGQYTAASQTALLTELDHAQAVLTNLQATQAEIDEVAANLLAQMSRLETQAKHRSTVPVSAKLSTPAPVISAILPATMIDEMSPASTWSSGVTMIDELTPFVTDATTREKMLRAMRPQLKALFDAIVSPFRKLMRSIKIGAKAGLQAYRDSLHG